MVANFEGTFWLAGQWALARAGSCFATKLSSNADRILPGNERILPGEQRDLAGAGFILYFSRKPSDRSSILLTDLLVCSRSFQNTKGLLLEIKTHFSSS